MGQKFRRILEFLMVLLIIAVICGIAVPILAKSITRARAVVAKKSLASAEQVIDVATLDSTNVDLASLKQSCSKIQWLEYKGQGVDKCKRFWQDRLSSIYFIRLSGGGLCIFAIPTDDCLLYSIYSEGAWHKGEKMGHSPQLPAAILSLR